jgi:CRISPR-associated endonuclease Cas2
MSKPKKIELTLQEALFRMHESGVLKFEKKTISEDDYLLPLPERIQKIVGIVKKQPLKSTTMNYMILYDIENNKIRKLISDFLIKNGCVRVQKSVFMGNSEHQKFQTIHDTLKDINSYYENADSIIMVPINVSDVRSMKLIGKNVNIDLLTNPPNTLFF